MRIFRFNARVSDHTSTVASQSVCGVLSVVSVEKPCNFRRRRDPRRQSQRATAAIDASGRSAKSVTARARAAPRHGRSPSAERVINWGIIGTGAVAHDFATVLNAVRMAVKSALGTAVEQSSR